MFTNAYICSKIMKTEWEDAKFMSMVTSGEGKRGKSAGELLLRICVLMKHKIKRRASQLSGAGSGGLRSWLGPVGGSLVDAEGDPGPWQFTAQALTVRPEQTRRQGVCVSSRRAENVAEPGRDDHSSPEGGNSELREGARTSALDGRITV